jgi:anti-sigma factor RsiW
MNCHEQPEILDGYVDGELDLANCLEIERHLRECAACRQRAGNIKSAREKLREFDLSFRAPARLRARVLKEIRPRPSAWTALWNWSPGWGALAASVAATAVAAFLAGEALRKPKADDFAIAEAVSAHVRSLLASHLVDVASTDQHTVKPWFEGKLDFAPPVVDLAAEGFPLIGGRLEYIDGREAAALVYRRNKHPINVLVTKRPATGLAARKSQSSGYNFVEWPQGEMVCRAVSDLNMTELAAFCEAWRRAAAR